MLLKAVRHHARARWILLYPERWLIAPMMPDGECHPHDWGTPHWKSALMRVDWNSIWRRPRSSTARMMTGEKTTRHRASISSAIPSALGGRRIVMGSTSSTSHRRSATRQGRPFARWCGVGRCTVALTSHCSIWRTCSMRGSGVGLGTTVFSTSRHCIRRCADRPTLREMGDPKIQTAQGASPACQALAGSLCSAEPSAVCTLAVAVWIGWIRGAI